MSADKRIHRVTVKRTLDSGRIDIRAEAEVRNGDAVETIASSGISVRSDVDTPSLKEMEDAQLSELRKQLYAVGFSKRAIATAVKSVTHD
jgi:hypothetical protein